MKEVISFTLRSTPGLRHWGISCCSQDVSSLHHFTPKIEGASKGDHVCALGSPCRSPAPFPTRICLAGPQETPGSKGGTCIFLCASLTPAHPGCFPNSGGFASQAGRAGLCHAEESQVFLTQACLCSTMWLMCYCLFSPFSDERGGDYSCGGFLLTCSWE